MPGYPEKIRKALKEKKAELQNVRDEELPFYAVRLDDGEVVIKPDKEISILISRNDEGVVDDYKVLENIANNGGSKPTNISVEGKQAKIKLKGTYGDLVKFSDLVEANEKLARNGQVFLTGIFGKETMSWMPKEVFARKGSKTRIHFTTDIVRNVKDVLERMEPVLKEHKLPKIECRLGAVDGIREMVIDCPLEKFADLEFTPAFLADAKRVYSDVMREKIEESKQSAHVLREEKKRAEKKTKPKQMG